VAQLLADLFFPGITTQTGRARYYALYCWILWHIQTQGKSRRWEDFVQSFQKREAAIALSTLIDDANSSPVGKRAAERRLAESEADKEVNISFRVLPSNQLGGFGQYYVGSLYALGLTHRPENGLFETTDVGCELAQAVQRTLSETPYIQRKLYAESKIQLKALRESSERLSVDAITRSFAGGERTRLTDLFFGFRQERPWLATEHRRLSLSRILTLISAYESAGIQVDSESLQNQLLYGPSYFGVLVDTLSHTKSYAAPKWLQQCSEFWRQFCLHQFLTMAIEGLLNSILDVLEKHTEGNTPVEVVQAIASDGFVEYLNSATNKACDTPRALLGALGIARIPDQESCLRLRQQYVYSHPLSEWVCEREASTPPALAARASLLLAILYGKWRGVITDASYRFVAERAGAELAAPNVLPLLDSWWARDSSWQDVLLAMVTLIVQQHDRVMYSKGRLESCWLHREETRIVLDQPYTPAIRSSRHEQAVQILADLGLLGRHTARDKSSLQITERGRAVLKRAESESK